MTLYQFLSLANPYQEFEIFVISGNYSGQHTKTIIGTACEIYEQIDTEQYIVDEYEAGGDCIMVTTYRRD